MGSRNKNTGENRSKRMANELNLAGSQVARGTSLHGTNQAFDKALRDEVKKGRKVAGTNIRHGFNALKNIDPNDYVIISDLDEIPNLEKIILFVKINCFSIGIYQMSNIFIDIILWHKTKYFKRHNIHT